ncbi:MAG: DUF1553 domain-containing protein [Pirellulaceae bacterium]|nr:DUF1553 domain-containing protein [Pirellulaceae bacterium]
MRIYLTSISMVLLISSLASAEDAALPKVVSFNEHIRPIFNQHCVACHGGVKQAADISFVYKDQVLPPDGWIVEPGEPDESLLIERVLETDPELRMPPAEHGSALSEHEIALLTEWIKQGAIWDASYWAYAAAKAKPLPSVSDPTWGRQPIDHFVLARLDAEKMEPSGDAPPERWLRRVTLDLIGLPPTIEQLDAFLKDYERDREAARETVVERLLASPALGERWASVWLDQIRYADSRGLGADGRRSVWKYRDWVIDSLNRDLPYDQFTIQQIAGDLLPHPTVEDKIATAAHRVTQSNEEGGTDDEEFRVAAVLDRVNTTWQAWQGVTFGCVQCHSHPYDPFRHEEYYQFAAFFNNTADCDLNEDWPVIQAPVDAGDYDAASKLDRQIDAVNKKLWDREYQLLVDTAMWKPIVGMTASTSNQTKVVVNRVGDHDEFQTVGTVSRNADITLESPLPDGVSKLTAIRLTAMPLDPKTAVSDSEWGFVMSHIDAKLVVDGEEKPRDLAIKRLIIDEPDPFYDPQLSLDPKSNRGFAAFTRISQPRQAALVLESPVTIPENARLQITLEHRIYILSAFSLIARRGHLAVTDDERLTQSLTDDEFVAMRDELARLRKERSKIKSVSVPVMQELPEHLSRPTHVFERGLFLTKGDRVTPGTPASLPPLPEGRVDRLALARWLVAPENPLTSRVAVNRVWAQLFGIGLVATEEDFGSSGEVPSHPDLLDFLALRFQNEQEWSQKEMIREIVLSRTYGQSSKVSDELHQRDPRNRLLARGPRFRLSSEVVRDQALALSGLLTDKQFGPPVHPPIPEGVWKPFQAGDKWNVPKPGDKDRYRRSIYTYMKRSIPYPMFAAFDAPSREFCAPRRLRSNTPLQALMMLNDEVFAECTSALANRMRASAEQPSEQIRAGFRIVTCRQPSEEDLQDLLALMQSARQDKQNAGEKNDKTQNDDDPNDDGLDAVASVLLNLDEVVMK